MNKPPVSKERRGNNARLLCFAPLLIPFLATLLLDNSYVADAAWANWLIKKVLRLVPYMTSHAESTRFPHLALVSHALSIIFIAFCSLLLCTMSLADRHTIFARMGSYTTSRLLINPLIAVPVALGMHYMFSGIGGDPSWARGLTVGSRWGFAVMKLGIDSTCTLLLGGAPIFWLAFLARIFNGGRNNGFN